MSLRFAYGSVDVGSGEILDLDQLLEDDRHLRAAGWEPGCETSLLVHLLCLSREEEAYIKHGDLLLSRATLEMAAALRSEIAGPITDVEAQWDALVTRQMAEDRQWVHSRGIEALPPGMLGFLRRREASDREIMDALLKTTAGKSFYTAAAIHTADLQFPQALVRGLYAYLIGRLFNPELKHEGVGLLVGNPAATDRPYGGPLGRWARKKAFSDLTKDAQDDAAAAYSAAFVKALDRLSPLALLRPRPAIAYAKTAGLHAASAELRLVGSLPDANGPETLLMRLSSPESQWILDRIVGEPANHLDRVIQVEATKELRAAIAQLPTEQGTAVKLQLQADDLGITLAEICRAKGLAYGRVNRNKLYGLTRLAELLKHPES